MLTAKRATPLFGVADQLHDWIKHLLHRELALLGKMPEDDLTKIPGKSLSRSGGMFAKKRGYKRGRTLFLYCLAVAKVRAILKQKQYVVLAAFCKCGFYDINQAGNLFGIKADLAKGGADELDNIQKEIKATRTWLDTKHDFSGQKKPKNMLHGVTWPA